jgi:hypothetical protein
MSPQSSERQVARYRFDPHTGGIVFGLGRLRMAALLCVLALGVAALYRGALVGALVFLVLTPPLVLWNREGIPAVLWIPLRLIDRFGDREDRGWSQDPELTPHHDSISEH